MPTDLGEVQSIDTSTANEKSLKFPLEYRKKLCIFCHTCGIPYQLNEI